MDSRERLIELQNSFSRKHMGILVVVCIFILVNFIMDMGNGVRYFIPCAVMCAILLADLIFSLFSFFHNFYLLRVIKIFETITAGYFICYGHSSAVGGYVDIFVICFFIMFCIELGYILDLSDRNHILLYCLLLHSPYLIKMITSFVKYAPQMYETFIYFVVGTVSIVIIFSIYDYIGMIQKYNEKCLYAKDRMLDRAEENYNKVTANQKDLMTANEQLAIKKYELEEAYKKINIINKDINFQNLIMKISSSSLDLNEVLHKCSEAIINAEKDIFFANILFKDKNMRKNFSCRLEKMMEPLEFKEFLNFFLSDAFIDEHQLLGTFYVNNEVSFDEFPFLEKIEARSIIVKSIKVQSEDFVSVFVIMSHAINTFKDKETLYDNILSRIEVSSNNIFMYSKIREMSNRDGLSGLYNRRYLNMYFNDHFTYKNITGTAVAALLDIDYFKSINDTYGHLFGDQAIITVASVIKSIASQNDGLTFRYGGEEFVVLFENISLDDAVIIMERMRIHIKETPITHNGVTVYANVSIGVAGYPETTSNLSSLIDRADKAMYYSKQNGRDRLTVDKGQD